MKTIHPLSKELIGKIAAGEVIERPAYAVKELIENSIDAKATQISLYLRNGGIDEITIIDNGKGMSKDDVKESFKPHTTSKISYEHDLNNISSFGFRGEALSSIAAISDMTIKTKQAADVGGTLIELKAGKLQTISPVGMPTGTQITINNLFYTVPARKKFLKNSGSEFHRIMSIITYFALAYPHIRFFVSHNKKTVLTLPSHQTLHQRTNDVLGKTMTDTFLPVDYKDSYISISGFIAHPQTISTNQEKQYIFVNGRAIKDKHISSIAKQVYGTLLEAKAYPVFILFIQLPFETVDVNIHPRKEHVLFANSTILYEAIDEAITKTLQSNNLQFQKKDEHKFLGKKGFTQSTAATEIKEQTQPWQVKLIEIDKAANVLQIHNLYILVSTKDGIIIIDQHAAHERILYEQFLQTYSRQKSKSVMLTRPITVDVPLTDVVALKEHQQELKAIGFTIKSIDKNSVTISGIPFLFKDRNMKELLAEAIETILDEGNVDVIDSRTDRMLKYLACRSAIKAGDKLTKQQMKDLLKKLAKTKNNITCPHGRPTQLNFSLDELHSSFKRR